MIDLALDLVKKDLLIDGLDLKLVDKSDYIRQSLQIRLSFFRGEWFLDTEAGTPFYQDVFVKDPNLPNIENIFKARIIETEGVNELLSFSLELASDRSAKIEFQVNTIYGIVDFSETIFV